MVLALALLVSQVAAPVEAAAPIVVRGRVVDAQTGEPIAKATVSVPASKIEVATDGAGVFVLPNVHAAARRLRAARRPRQQGLDGQPRLRKNARIA